MTPSSNEQAAAAILLEDPSQPGAAPLLVAVAGGLLRVTVIRSPREPWPARRLLRSPSPLLISIPDVGVCGGPDEWRTARRLRAWCAGALVWVDEAPSEHQADMLVELTVRLHRLVLVETPRVRVDAWQSWAGPALLNL